MMIVFAVAGALAGDAAVKYANKHGYTEKGVQMIEAARGYAGRRWSW